jgi:hypothetical protein
VVGAQAWRSGMEKFVTMGDTGAQKDLQQNAAAAEFFASDFGGLLGFA